MENPKTSKKKPRLTKDGLERHNVEYEPEVLDKSARLPENVAMVRDALLRFNKKIHIAYRSVLKVDLDDITATSTATLSALPENDDSYWKLPRVPGQKHQRESEELVEIISSSEGIADEFKALKNEAEATWTHRLIADIFQRYDIGEMSRNGKIEENTLWSAQPNVEQAPDGPYLTTPKPDLTYAYPLFRPTDEVPRLFSMWDCMTCYSTGLVQDLGRKGVKCTLTNHLYDDKEGTAGLERLRKPDLTAFPWAVVEVKPDDVSDSTEVFCFNQAANASAAAVRMYKRLIGLCPGLQALHIPPVVAYTCVGAAVKVWLTCCDNEGQKTRMVCIWSASLRSIWGVLSVQLIVENMRSWALTILRNQLNIALWAAKDSMYPGQPSSAQDVDHLSRGSLDKAVCFAGGSTEGDDEGRDAPTDVAGTHPTAVGSNSPRTVPAQETVQPASDAQAGAQCGEHFDIPQPKPYRSPGQDSGIVPDVGLSPGDPVLARSLRYQNSVASDVRAAAGELHGTPSKAPSHRDAEQAPDGVLTLSNDAVDRIAVYTPVTPSKASAEFEVSGAVVGASPAPSANTTTENEQNANISEDNRERTPFQPSPSPRPSARRQTSSGVARDLTERFRALTGDMIDCVSKHSSVHYPDLSLVQQLEQEASRQRRSANRSLFNPAMMFESPVQTPLRETTAAEQDDNNSMRPDISSRRSSSFFSRHSSSKVLEAKRASTTQNDASSEVSVSSSRAGSFYHKHMDPFVTDLQTSYRNLDIKGGVETVKKVAAPTVQRFKSKKWDTPARSSCETDSADRDGVTRHSPVGGGSPKEKVGEDGQGAGSEAERNEVDMPGAWAA